MSASGKRGDRGDVESGEAIDVTIENPGDRRNEVVSKPALADADQPRIESNDGQLVRRVDAGASRRA
jgi:hypothetical protein